MIKTYNKQKNIAGSFIRKCREERKISRDQLSKLLELQGVYISKDELYRIENNQLMIKDFELTAIFVVLDIDLNNLKNYLDN